MYLFFVIAVSLSWLRKYCFSAYILSSWFCLFYDHQHLYLVIYCLFFIYHCIIILTFIISYLFQCVSALSTVCITCCIYLHDYCHSSKLGWFLRVYVSSTIILLSLHIHQPPFPQKRCHTPLLPDTCKIAHFHMSGYIITCEFIANCW